MLRREVTKENLAEMQMLAASGDISVQQNRTTFKIRTGHETTLTDDEILTIHAMDDDGPSGDAWFIEQMLAFEKWKTASEQA